MIKYQKIHLRWQADDVKLKGGFLDGPLRGHDSDVDDTGKNKAQDPMDGDFGLHHRQTHTHTCLPKSCL